MLAAGAYQPEVLESRASSPIILLYSLATSGFQVAASRMVLG